MLVLRTWCAFCEDPESMVLSLFRRKSSEPARPNGRVPEGRLVVAVGDVHGRLDLLERLWGSIEAVARVSAARERTLVFVGDYIDRGLQSRQVVDRLLEGFAGFETVFLKGNHDETLVQFLADPQLGEGWRNFGGLETLRSYGVQHKPGGEWAQTRAEFASRIPEAHLTFFKSLRLHYAVGDYLFVHNDRFLSCDHCEFLNSTMSFGRIVVHGHTPERSPVVRANRIGIDTGAYMTGVLTALVLEGSAQRFLSTG